MKWPTASLFVNGVWNGKHWALTRDSGYTAQKSRGLSGLIRGENGHPAQNAKKVNNGRGGRVLAKFYGEICGQTYSALAVLHFIKTPAWFHASPSVIAIYPEDSAPFQNVLLKPSAEGNRHEFIHSQGEVSFLMELAECQVVKTADDWAEIIIFPFFSAKDFGEEIVKLTTARNCGHWSVEKKRRKFFPGFEDRISSIPGEGEEGIFLTFTDWANWKKMDSSHEFQFGPPLHHWVLVSFHAICQVFWYSICFFFFFRKQFSWACKIAIFDMSLL